MRDYYRLARLARKYEKLFEIDLQGVLKERNFHKVQLERIIEQAKEALELASTEITYWSGALQEVKEVEDADTILKKAFVACLRWYAERKYKKAVKESELIKQEKERFQKLLNKLLILSA